MAEERFIGGWTRAVLAARTPQERYVIWKRAMDLRSAEGAQLAREIERLGLPYGDPGLLEPDDPVSIEMAEIIASPLGRSACIEATLDGLPAIAGVDPLLHQALGAAYRRNDLAIATAAVLVADLMREAGYAEAGEKDLPNRCVARRGVFWKHL